MSLENKTEYVDFTKQYGLQAQFWLFTKGKSQGDKPTEQEIDQYIADAVEGVKVKSVKLPQIPNDAPEIIGWIVKASKSCKLSIMGSVSGTRMNSFGKMEKSLGLRETVDYIVKIQSDDEWVYVLDISGQWYKLRQEMSATNLWHMLGLMKHDLECGDIHSRTADDEILEDEWLLEGSGYREKRISAGQKAWKK